MPWNIQVRASGQSPDNNEEEISDTQMVLFWIIQSQEDDKD